VSVNAGGSDSARRMVVSGSVRFSETLASLGIAERAMSADPANAVIKNAEKKTGRGEDPWLLHQRILTSTWIGARF